MMTSLSRVTNKIYQLMYSTYGLNVTLQLEHTRVKVKQLEKEVKTLRDATQKCVILNNIND